VPTQRVKDALSSSPSPASVFTELTSCFTKRHDSLAAVLGGVLTYPGPVDCVAHLSTTTPGYAHSGLYAALEKGRVDTARLTRLLVEYGNQDDLYEDVYSTDATTWARPDANTVDDRVMSYTTKGTKSGSKAIPGWSYQVVARQTHQTGSWSLPVCVARIGPDDEHSKFTAGQIKAVTEVHRGTKPLFVLDSGYPGPCLTHLLKRDQVDANVLVRLHSDRVMRELLEEPTKRGPGRPVKHGARFPFAKPPRDPDASVTFSCHRYGDVQVDAYHNLHPALSHDHAGAKEMLKETGKLPIISGTVLHVSCTKRTGNAGWWLWYDGDSPDLERLFWCYAHRFDIEHTFRCCKQSLGLTATSPGSARVADMWVTDKCGASEACASRAVSR